jgi:hypothetical protein
MWTNTDHDPDGLAAEAPVEQIPISAISTRAHTVSLRMVLDTFEVAGPVMASLLLGDGISATAPIRPARDGRRPLAALKDLLRIS